MELSLSELVLARVNLLRAGCPAEIMASVENQDQGMPVVIKANRRRLGYVEKTDYWPPAVVVAGQARRCSLLKEGRVTDWAWVEENILAALKIRADDAISTNELFARLDSLLRQRYVGDKNAPYSQQWPMIVQVYPFENYLIFEWQGKKFRQGYKLDPTEREVGLDGKPMPVEEKYVDACMPVSSAGGGSTVIRESMTLVDTGHRYFPAHSRANSQSSNTGAPNSELVRHIIRDWSNIQEAVNMYLDAVKHGLYKPMRPAFYPVSISDEGKVMQALAAKGIAPTDFARWTLRAKRDAEVNRTKMVNGDHIPRAKFALIGNAEDSSTWKLPMDTPARTRKSIMLLAQMKIPQDWRRYLSARLEWAAKCHGIQ